MPGKNDITRFIRSTFKSVWSLELLCFLRANADRAWLPDALIAELRASDLIIDQTVEALVESRLVHVEPDGAVRYAPATEALDLLAAATTARYARGPDAVRRLIAESAALG